jgi:RNA-directed DNA polymerase
VSVSYNATPLFPGKAAKVYRIVDRHVRKRLCRWLCRKLYAPRQGTARYPDQYQDSELPVVRLAVRTRSFPSAQA